MQSLFGDAEKDYLPPFVPISEIMKLYDIHIVDLISLISSIDCSLFIEDENTLISWELFDLLKAILENDVCEGTCKRKTVKFK